jgi:VanZ family protein
MEKQSSIRIIMFILFTTIGVSFLLFNNFGKSQSRLLDEILNYGHIFLFGFISLGISRVIGMRTWPNLDKIVYFRSGIITFLLGFLSECIQTQIPNRTFGLNDLFNDTLGAATFLVLAYTFQTGIMRRTLILLRSIVLSIIIIMTYPIGITALDSWNMARDFPILSSFESTLELSRWKDIESSSQRMKIHATNGIYSYQTRLHPGMFPGISMEYMMSDWKDYRELSFDTFLEGTKPLNITVRINDKEHNDEFLDRYNKQFTLQPGRNHTIVVLNDVRKAPQGREMDMADISIICIFAYNLDEPRVVYFDNIRLKK